MLHLIIGGAASGKSEYGERVAVKCLKSHRESADAKMYYVATMYAYDEESKKRVEKHRFMRAGKGFETIECPYQIETLCDCKNHDFSGDDVLLLECMSNLLANEMYMDEGNIKKDEQKPDSYDDRCFMHIIEPILKLAEKVGDLIIITNDIFSDENANEQMNIYSHLLGLINAAIAKKANHVTEVVCSIPLVIK